MIVCHVCGTENPDGAKFCEGCGVELQADGSAMTTPAASPAVTPPVAAATMPPVQVTPPLEATSLPVEEPPLEVDEPIVPNDPPAVASSATDLTMSAPVATDPAAVEPDLKATMPDTPSAPMQTPPTVVAAGESKPKVARLIPRHAGATAGETYTLSGEHMVVGRFDPSAGPVDIDLAGQQGEGYISRRHAELYLQDGAWFVRDLGSTNGVYVKKAGQGQYSPRIIEPAALGDGDELAFGNVKFLFLYSSEA